MRSKIKYFSESLVCHYGILAYMATIKKYCSVCDRETLFRVRSNSSCLDCSSRGDNTTLFLEACQHCAENGVPVGKNLCPQCHGAQSSKIFALPLVAKLSERGLDIDRVKYVCCSYVGWNICGHTMSFSQVAHILCIIKNCAKAGPRKTYLRSAEAVASWLGRALQGKSTQDLSKTLRRIWESYRGRESFEKTNMAPEPPNKPV